MTDINITITVNGKSGEIKQLNGNKERYSILVRRVPV